MNGAAAIVGVLMLRDLRRLVRRPGQIVASIATPAMLWLLLAGGLAGAVRVDEGGYTQYLADGFALLVVVFSSIFAAHALIEDRRDGFLTQTVLSGAPPLLPAAARAFSGAVVAWVQAVPLLLPGGPRAIGALIGAGAWLAAASLAITALSLAIATRCATARAFHGFMNVVLMPAWLLSGAVFPLATAHRAVRVASGCNPLAWIHGLMRGEAGLPAALAAVLFTAIALTAAAVAMSDDRALVRGGPHA